ncbi:hypothetical protein Slin15195_G129850 [Septoria linicola]|uniref:Uncharacterized protein n=1 Tax=Septoria linicola TaxID=215465 RepID=A0A9Q9BB33_9PEZI|nr:hypothetical protein Slin15195_G129850 [Septoria linicola]
MASDWKNASEWLDGLMADRSLDMRWNFCTTFIKNNLEAQSSNAWKIFCCWEYMERAHGLEAVGFRSRLAIPERLDDCVAGKRETRAKEQRARASIAEHWPTWDFRIVANQTDRAPANFSLGLLEKLAVLARENAGQEVMLSFALAMKVTERIRFSRSMITVVKPGDVDVLLAEIRRARRPAPVPAPVSPAPGARSSPPVPLALPSGSDSIEQGRAGGLVLEDASSDSVVLGSRLPSLSPWLGLSAGGDSVTPCPDERPADDGPSAHLPPPTPPPRRKRKRLAHDLPPRASLEARIRALVDEEMRAARESAALDDSGADAALEVLEDWTSVQQENWLAGLPAPWRQPR